MDCKHPAAFVSFVNGSFVCNLCGAKVEKPEQKETPKKKGGKK